MVQIFSDFRGMQVNANIKTAKISVGEPLNLKITLTSSDGVTRIVKLPEHRDCTLPKAALLEARSGDHSARSENLLIKHTSLFQLPGWALLELSCFALQVILA